MILGARRLSGSLNLSQVFEDTSIKDCAKVKLDNDMFLDSKGRTRIR